MKAQFTIAKRERRRSITRRPALSGVELSRRSESRRRSNMHQRAKSFPSPARLARPGPRGTTASVRRRNEQHRKKQRATCDRRLAYHLAFAKSVRSWHGRRA